MMELAANNNESDSILDSTTQTKRSRTTLRSSVGSTGDPFKDGSSSFSDNSDCELSEDEWKMPSKKKGVVGKTQPKQTIKTKLAEKTKYLQKISKLNGQTEEKYDITSLKPLEGEAKTSNLKIKTDLDMRNLNNSKEMGSDNQSEDKKSEIKIVGDNSSRADITTSVEPIKFKIKNEEKERCITVKEESKKDNLHEVVKTSDREPMVLNCSINCRLTNSENNSPSPQTPRLKYVTVSQKQSLQINPFLVSSHASPSEIQNVDTGLGNHFVSQSFSHNSPLNAGMQRNQSAIGDFSTSHHNLSLNSSFSNSSHLSQNLTQQLQYSPAPNSCGRNKPSNQRSPLGNSIFQQTSASATLKRTPNNSQGTCNTTLRTPSPMQRKAAQTPRTMGSGNSSVRTRRLFSPGQNEKSPNFRNVARNNTSILMVKKSTFSKITTPVLVTANGNDRNSVLNTNKFKVLLCCYTIGIAGCNKIANTSHMDGGGDRPKTIPGLQSSLSVAQGSSTTSGKTSHTSIVDNAILFAEKSLRVAEEKVKRAEQSLKMAKDMKDSTSSKLQTTVQSNRSVSAQDTIQKLISIAKAEDDSAKNNLRVAEDKVKRTKENLKSAEYALELAKGSKK